MGKPSIQLPDVPKNWGDVSGGGGWPDFMLPDGQRLKDVIQQHRADLQDTVGRLQGDPNSLDGGLGYAAGHYLGMAWPHGVIDFKNKFKGQGNPDDLAKAGNFAYYAIGSGILPDTVLDAGASAYNLYKTVTGQNNDNSDALGPDASAQSVREKALAYGAGLE
jgi:hypothetical protein